MNSVAFDSSCFFSYTQRNTIVEKLNQDTWLKLSQVCKPFNLYAITLFEQEVEKIVGLSDRVSLFSKTHHVSSRVAAYVFYCIHKGCLINQTVENKQETALRVFEFFANYPQSGFFLHQSKKLVSIYIKYCDPLAISKETYSYIKASKSEKCKTDKEKKIKLAIDEGTMSEMQFYKESNHFMRFWNKQVEQSDRKFILLTALLFNKKLQDLNSFEDKNGKIDDDWRDLGSAVISFLKHRKNGA